MAWLQFYWPGIAFTVTQALVYGLTIWLVVAITRWSLRRRHQVQDREELVNTIREKQSMINQLSNELDAQREESARLRALIIGNTQLAAQLLANHQSVSEQAWAAVEKLERRRGGQR